jgi:4-hydroxybenzoate polyprenyltransferase
VGDSLRLQAFPVLGVLYAGSGHLLRDPRSAELLFLGLLLLFAHIFALNDWANVEEDALDPRKAGWTFRSRGVASGTMRNLTLALGVSAVLVLGLLPGRTWPYASWLFAVGVLYSHPLLAVKRIPIVSSAMHVVSGTVHFLIGYVLYRPVEGRALLVALWCGLVLAAGHLVQEVEDHDGDRASSIRTHAVRFGKRRVFIAAFVLFVISFLYLAALAMTSLLPYPVSLLALLCPFLAYAFWLALRRGLESDAVLALRRRYRLLFAGTSMVIAAALWGA